MHVVSKQQDSNSFSYIYILIQFLLAYFKNWLTIVWLYLPEMMFIYRMYFFLSDETGSG